MGLPKAPTRCYHRYNRILEYLFRLALYFKNILKKIKFILFFCFNINFLVFLYYFDMLILKIIFKKYKNIILIYF